MDNMLEHQGMLGFDYMSPNLLDKTREMVENGENAVSCIQSYLDTVLNEWLVYMKEMKQISVQKNLEQSPESCKVSHDENGNIVMNVPLKGGLCAHKISFNQAKRELKVHLLRRFHETLGKEICLDAITLPNIYGIKHVEDLLPNMDDVDLILSGNPFGKKSLITYYRHLKDVCEKGVDSRHSTVSIAWRVIDGYRDYRPQFEEVLFDPCTIVPVKKDMFYVTIQPSNRHLSRYQFRVDPESESPDGELVKKHLSEYRRNVVDGIREQKAQLEKELCELEDFLNNVK